MLNEVKPRKHQERFLNNNPDHAVLFWTPRAGKSYAAEKWMDHPVRNKYQIVVCKKSNKSEWQERCQYASVYTKEEFKTHCETIHNCSAIVVDELHHHLSPLFIPKERSAQAEALYNFLRKHRPHFLGLTGTPLTNKPASLHTLLVYINHYVDWKKKFRPMFYSLEYRPYLPRPAWLPKKGWRKKAMKALYKYTDVVTLKEIAPDLPEEIIEIVETKAGKYPYQEDEDENWMKDHQAEQYNKASVIKELELPKAIIVCKYTAQIDELAKKLKGQKPVYILDGRTKNQAKTIKDAQEEVDCYLIVQAQCGEGFDGYHFDVMVFASMGHRVIDWDQMRMRLFSVDHQKPRIYYYLISDGKWDRAIYKSVIEDNKDFNLPYVKTK